MEPVHHNFLRPSTAESGELYRPMPLGNCCPGEEGRVAQVAKGENPPRSKEFGTVQVHATGEEWFGYQMLHASTETPILDPSYMVPNWA
eukprot:5922138-Pyramimonas_sp.AAC.1